MSPETAHEAAMRGTGMAADYKGDPVKPEAKPEPKGHEAAQDDPSKWQKPAHTAAPQPATPAAKPHAPAADAPSSGLWPKRKRK